MRRLFALAFAIVLPAAHAGLPEPVSAALAAGKLPDGALAAIVIRGDTIVLAHQAERPMQPASTMKLVSTLVGLEQLGPVFKGRTELRTDGEIVRGALKGDLVLRGGADVDLSAEALEKMLQSLRFQGIRKIDGRLLVDRSLFTPSRFDVGMPPFDETPEAYYNVIPDAALVNRNMIDLDLRSTDKRLQINMLPALDKVSITSDMELVDTACEKWEDGWQQPEVKRGSGGKLTIVLHGTYPKNCVRPYWINVLDRQDYVDRLFRSTWRKVGGQFDGEVVEAAAPAGTRLLAEHVSRALPEIIRDTNKPSDNLFARTIFLSLGALENDAALGSKPIAGIETQSTLVRSDSAVRSWFHAHGINDDGLVLENGSGLSRLERISPVQMAGLLKAGLKSLWAPEFQASLPIVAVDGTMRRRLKDSPAAQRARLKTGGLRNVAALAGYVPDAKGELCIVVAMVNDDNISNGKGRAVLDALIDWVARN